MTRFSCILLVVLLGAVVVSVSSTSEVLDYSIPGSPATWICFTTAGAANITGGYVDKTKCNYNGTSTTVPYVGYIGALVAVIGFGSNFIPVKKFDTGDGMFFQWILCIGIWLVSVVVNIVRLQPPFFIPVLFGGVLWTTGNVAVVPIIKMIGMTMGLTIWGLTNLLAGWITGRFILEQGLNCHWMNYVGLAIIVISVLILGTVKSEGKKSDENLQTLSENAPLINSRDTTSSLSGSLADKLVIIISVNIISLPTVCIATWKKTDSHYTITFKRKTSSPTQSDVSMDERDDEDYSWVDKLGKWPRRICGITLALGIGFLFGFQFLSVEFMRLCVDDTHSCNELDYVFGHFTGILLASTFWFVVYCIWKRNKPKVYPKVILPALGSGILWGIAMVGWFIANENLSLAVSFPIITTGPGIVSSFWGIVIYREIKGWKNIAIFFGGFIISLCGQILVGLSNKTFKC